MKIGFAGLEIPEGKIKYKDQILTALAEKDATAKQLNEELFQAKIEAFEMDVVRNSPHKKLKSAIRRSKTLMEVTATVGAVIALANMVEDVDGGTE